MSKCNFQKDTPNLSSWGKVKIGNEECSLFYDQNNFHSIQTSREYIDYGRKELVPFDGHRYRWKVVIEEYNYLKESHISGDEIRKGGICKLFVNDTQVYEFFFRRVHQALLQAHDVITKLNEHPIGLVDLGNREKVVGRLIYFHGEPGIVSGYITDQGAVVIEREDGKPFKQPIWADGDCDDIERTEVKDDILSPHIWWWRDNEKKN